MKELSARIYAQAKLLDIVHQRDRYAIVDALGVLVQKYGGVDDLIEFMQALSFVDAMFVRPHIWPDADGSWGIGFMPDDHTWHEQLCCWCDGDGVPLPMKGGEADGDDSKFIADVTSFDSVREEAARCCDEAARYERGERGPLRDPMSHGPLAEFSDAAFGVAAEVAATVGQSFAAAGHGWPDDLPWTTAATMLRGGWQRGHSLKTHVTGKVQPS